MRHCRKCKTPKWGTDPCTNPDCPVNTVFVTRLRASKIECGSAVSTRRFGGGTSMTGFMSGPRLLSGERYVADFDGQHYIR